MNLPDSTICERLERLRTEMFGERGKSRMARELGIRPSTYDRYERDRVPPADLLVKISQVASVTLEWLMTGNGLKHPVPVLDPEGTDLSQRFDEAIAMDVALRPVAKAFLTWLDNRRRLPEQTSQQFELPSDTPASASERVIVDTSIDTRGREPGATTSAGGSGSGEGGSSESGFGGGRSSESDKPRPGASPSAGSLQSASSLIPIVGRTSAGFAAYWQDLIVRPGDERERQVQQLLATTESPVEFLPRASEKESSEVNSASAVQVVRLSRTDAGVLEFVQAASLKSQFPRAVAWQIDGDSMEPRFFHGDLVVTSVDAPATEGQPCVVRQRGQVGVTCKVYHREGDMLVLIPINPRVNVQRIPMSDVEYATRVLYVIRNR